MKFLVLLLILWNIVPIFCEAEKECQQLVEFLKTAGHVLSEDCCNEPGIECRDSSIFSIDLTLNPGVLDISKFPEFSNLDKLSIKGDVYQGEIPLEYFNFRVLDISNSKIKNVPLDIVFNLSVEELYLNDNLIESFPNILSELSELKILNLDNNKMKGKLDINDDSLFSSFDFSGLEKLSVQNNELEGEIIFPESLKYLNIQNNYFSSLKCNDDDCNLNELKISNNIFDNKVFEQLKDQKNLKIFESRNNKNITMVTEDIGNLSNLEILDLSNNNLEEIHSNLFALSNLKNINLSENPNLEAKIINFGGKEPVATCNFSNIKMSCYEPNTCENIGNDYYYTTCTSDEIEAIKKSQTVKKSMSLFKKIVFASIFIIAAISTSTIVICCCCLNKCVHVTKKVFHGSDDDDDNKNDVKHNNNESYIDFVNDSSSSSKKEDNNVISVKIINEEGKCDKSFIPGVDGDIVSSSINYYSPPSTSTSPSPSSSTSFNVISVKPSAPSAPSAPSSSLNVNSLYPSAPSAPSAPSTSLNVNSLNPSAPSYNAAESGSSMDNHDLDDAALPSYDEVMNSNIYNYYK